MPTSQKSKEAASVSADDARSQELKSAIEVSDREIAELQSTLKQFDAEDVAAANRMTISPVDGSLFAQIQATISTQRQIEGDAAANQARAEARSSVWALLAEKTEVRSRLQKELENINRVRLAKIEGDRINQLVKEFDAICDQLVDVVERINAAPVENLILESDRYKQYKQQHKSVCDPMIPILRGTPDLLQCGQVRSSEYRREKSKRR